MVKIAHLQRFHLFPQCFPKAFILNVIKRVYMEERVKTLQQSTGNCSLRTYLILPRCFEIYFCIKPSFILITYKLLGPL